MSNAPVDFGKRSADYGQHRPGFPDSFYERLDRLCPLRGRKALDVGTGPGIVALELAKRGATVTGLDIAENQIETAEARAKAVGLDKSCHFLVRPTEDTALDSNAFDLVTAGQCWIWFDEQAALAEIRRVLKPGGVLVIAHYCYLAMHSPIARQTEALILKHNPSWTMAGHSGLYPQQIDPPLFRGFELLEQFCYDHDRMFTHEGWRGRMRTCNGVGSGGLSDDAVATFDSELAILLQELAPEQTFPVRHRIWATLFRRQ